MVIAVGRRDDCFGRRDDVHIVPTTRTITVPTTRTENVPRPDNRQYKQSVSQFAGLLRIYLAMRYNSSGFRIIWSWKRGCQANGIPFSLAYRVTARFNPPMVVDNKPRRCDTCCICSSTEWFFHRVVGTVIAMDVGTMCTSSLQPSQRRRCITTMA